MRMHFNRLDDDTQEWQFGDFLVDDVDTERFKARLNSLICDERLKALTEELVITGVIDKDF